MVCHRVIQNIKTGVRLVVVVMFEVKSNDDGTYSILKDGSFLVGATLKNIKQNFITTRHQKRTAYQLTDLEATISIPNGKGGFNSVSGVPVK